jgi:FMN-dependent NADH-azoreductase
MKLLRIDSSARRSSVSRQLTTEFVDAWKKKNPSGEVVERDLAVTPLPLITDEWTQAAHTPTANLTSNQRETLAVSDTLIKEIVEADTVVIGAPMYNFTIPAPLKGWIDQVVRVGKTVVWGANGPQGILQGKQVVIITSRGGSFLPGTRAAQYDYQEPYLRHIMGFIGLTNITFIHAENQKPGELAEPSRVAAIAQIQQIAAHQAGSA